MSPRFDEFLPIIKEIFVDQTYLSSSWVSNFLGFLGQHSHMKKCTLEPPGFCISGNLLGVVLETLRECTGALAEIDPRGLGFNDMGVVYGELPDVGETPPDE